MKYFFLLIISCVSISNATIEGVTVRTAINDFSCFPTQGYDFTFIRAFMRTGKVDPNARANVIAANRVGMAVNVFIRPCMECNIKPNEIVLKVIKELKGTVYYSIIVMIQHDDWSPNQTANCNYLKAMIAEIKRNEKNEAVGANSEVWNTVMGKNCLIGKDVKNLMWEEHDEEKDIKNFKPFGGFTAPTSKEYAGSVNVCEHVVDLLYLPQ